MAALDENRGLNISSNLIILRGPSCSGKTTVARRLFDLAVRKTVLIQQDHYREIFSPSGGGSKPNSDVIHQMIEHNTTISLQSGYDVILEGILSVRSYHQIINRIIESHSGQTHIFYFDVSLEETIRRLKTKAQAGNLSYGESELREWYPSAHKSNHTRETIIPESSSPQDTIETIVSNSRV